MKKLASFKKKITALNANSIFFGMRETDRIIAHRIFDIQEFDDTAWYYSRAETFSYFLKKVPLHSNLYWFEEDELAVILAYVKWLSNYNWFILLLLIIYFLLLALLVVIAYFVLLFI